MRYIALLLALSGCAEHAVDDNHGYGFSFDQSAPDGLRVRYANDQPPRVATLDEIYSDVATCMGIANLPSGPLVILKDGLVASADHDAMIFLDTGTIILDSQITAFGDWSLTAPLPAPRYVIKHEMVHYLLKQTGFPDDLNNAHASPYFDSCGH